MTGDGIDENGIVVPDSATCVNEYYSFAQRIWDINQKIMSLKALRKRRHTEPQLIAVLFVAPKSRLTATAERNTSLTALVSMQSDHLYVIITLKVREGLACVGKKNTFSRLTSDGGLFSIQRIQINSRMQFRASTDLVKATDQIPLIQNS